MLTLPAGQHTITAQYLGSPEYNPVTSTPLAVQVGTPGFTLSNTPATMAFSLGETAAETINLTSVAGFFGTVNLSCSSGVPAGATCIFTPAAVALTRAGESATLSLATLAPSTALIPIRADASVSNAHHSRWVWPAGASLGFLLLLPGIRRRSRWLYVPVLLFAACMTFFQGCGGGGGTGGSTSSSGSNPATTTIAIATSSSKVAYGTNVTLTATVTSSSASIGGTVAFYDGASQIGSSTGVSGGKATATVNSLSVGTHAITAKFSGDSINQPSTSTAINQGVTGTTELQVTAISGSVQQSLNVLVQVN